MCEPCTLPRCVLSVRRVMQDWHPDLASGDAGKDALHAGALQVVGALSDSELQHAHVRVAKHKSLMAQQLLGELKRDFDKQFKFTGKV